MTNYRSIGRLVATFGVKGELILQHHLGKTTSLKGLEVLFIEIKKEEMLPYFIQSAKSKSPEEIYLKLEGIDAKETAQKLLQKEIWLTEDSFQKFASKTAPVTLLGFHLINEGEIMGIELSTPGLRGQSGGPLFNSEGIICGMQSSTNHLHLGFERGVSERLSGSAGLVQQFFRRSIFSGFEARPTAVHQQSCT